MALLDSLVSPKICPLKLWKHERRGRFRRPAKQSTTGFRGSFRKNSSAASCHGDDGKGNRELGAPNLVDAISLYGNTRETIQAQIHRPKHGVMPPWKGRLGEAAVRQLAVYVHGLGGGEASVSE